MSSIKVSNFVEKTYGPALGMTKADAAERGRTLANRAGLESYYYKRPRDMSHETKIKKAVILSLLEHPDLIILDEPFTGLTFIRSIS